MQIEDSGSENEVDTEWVTRRKLGPKRKEMPLIAPSHIGKWLD